MNIGLERLIEGIIATLRTDVIPHVNNAYGRGQALGAIDVLSSIIPRVEWSRGPLIDAVTAKIVTLEKIQALLPDTAEPSRASDIKLLSTAELEAERDRLDRDIVTVLARVGLPNPDVAPALAAAVMQILKTHMHDELAQDMKLTRKPLFAEISAGGDRTPT